MSRYKEYVIWQSADNLWSAAEYASYVVGDREDPEWDEEWGYDYDYDSFSWVSVGHPTEQAARDAYSRYNRVNTGHSGEIVTHDTEPSDAKVLDSIACRALRPEKLTPHLKLQLQNTEA